MSTYSFLSDINSKVNNSVTYKSDLDQYSRPEYWCEAGTFGDCEDYALLKHRLILDSGFDPSKMYLSCCWTELGEYHCVLIVETQDMAYCLDNRYADVMVAADLPYKWDKALRGGKWYELSF